VVILYSDVCVSKTDARIKAYPRKSQAELAVEQLSEFHFQKRFASKITRTPAGSIITGNVGGLYIELLDHY